MALPCLALLLLCVCRRCPSAVPALSFDTAGLSDGEVMERLGQLPEEDIPAFLNRTKGLVVLMATVMQVNVNRGEGATARHPPQRSAVPKARPPGTSVVQGTDGPVAAPQGKPSLPEASWKRQQP